MAEQTITNGRYQWGVSYRRFQGDEGLSVRLLGPVDSVACELVRFDCFHKTPHFHTAVYDHNTIRAIEHENPVNRSIDQVESNFSNLVANSGGDTPQDEELQGHTNVVEQLKTCANQLVTQANQ